MVWCVGQTLGSGEGREVVGELPLVVDARRVDRAVREVVAAQQRVVQVVPLHHAQRRQVLQRPVLLCVQAPDVERRPVCVTEMNAVKERGKGTTNLQARRRVLKKDSSKV